ncbi:MAG: hypothetical protein KDD47_09160 [Acidobacteria bacterium]|nr:hypothetical protein [Acidobacteriota bacterium]
MPTPRPRLPDLIRTTLCLAASACLATSALADPMARVGLRMDWQAPVFLFDEAARQDVVSQTLAELERLLKDKRFRDYPQWRIAQEGETYDAEWTVRLREEAHPLTSGTTTLPAWKVFLEHEVQAGGKNVRLPVPEEASLLYDVGNILPRKSSTGLLRRIKEVLGLQVNDAFLDAANEALIHELSIAAGVVLDQERVIVPIHLAAYQATRDSLIGVRLTKNGHYHGLVVIKPASDVSEGDHEGEVWGRITDLEVPGVDNVTLPAWWFDRIPEVFAAGFSQWVYMHEYWPTLSAGPEVLSGSAGTPDS